MEKISESLMSLERELTTHAQGYKQVFLRNFETTSKITQVAYGEFSISDVCELHSHETMEEIFFFTEGEGNYIVGDKNVKLKAGVFVRIPVRTLHRLETTSSNPLKYVYFGVATD